jgi:hypothetical protein
LGQPRNAYDLFRNSDRLLRKGAVRWTWIAGLIKTCLILERNEEAGEWLKNSDLKLVHPTMILLSKIVNYRNSPTPYSDLNKIDKSLLPSGLTPAQVIETWFPAKLNYGAEMRSAIDRLHRDLDFLFQG